MVAIESGGEIIQPAASITVDDQEANILGRNLSSQIGIKLIKEKPKHY